MPRCGAAMPKTFLPGWRRESAWVSKGNSRKQANYYDIIEMACLDILTAHRGRVL